MLAHPQGAAEERQDRNQGFCTAVSGWKETAELSEGLIPGVTVWGDSGGPVEVSGQRRTRLSPQVNWKDDLQPICISPAPWAGLGQLLFTAQPGSVNWAWGATLP